MFADRRQRRDLDRLQLLAAGAIAAVHDSEAERRAVLDAHPRCLTRRRRDDAKTRVHELMAEALEHRGLGGHQKHEGAASRLATCERGGTPDGTLELLGVEG